MVAETEIDGLHNPPVTILRKKIVLEGVGGANEIKVAFVTEVQVLLLLLVSH
jgi:hypothetical protein